MISAQIKVEQNLRGNTVESLMNTAGCFFNKVVRPKFDYILYEDMIIDSLTENWNLDHWVCLQGRMSLIVPLDKLYFLGS